MLIVGPGKLLDNNYVKALDFVTEFVKGGKCTLILEPAYGVKTKEEANVLRGVSLTIEPVEWRGCESYVFAEDKKFPLWDGIKGEYLKMFNGGWGGGIDGVPRAALPRGSPLPPADAAVPGGLGGRLAGPRARVSPGRPSRQGFW